MGKYYSDCCFKHFIEPNISDKLLIFLSRLIFTITFIIFLFSTFVFGQQKTLGLTKNISGGLEDGYVLFAPMFSKTTYLIDKCGKKVHSWESDYIPGLSAYILPDGSLLRTGRTQDTFFDAGGKGGIIEKIDWEGNVIWSYILSNDSLIMHHDIYPMENGNILVVAWHGISKSRATAKGRIKETINMSKLWSESILEIKPTGKSGGQIVWQWNLVDHIIQDVNFSKPDYNVISNHPELMNINFDPNPFLDWIHINSIDYNKSLNQILISCHNTSEIWIIDHSTSTAEAASHSGGKYGKGGDLLYRWGNPQAYNKGTSSNQRFFYQHNAQFITDGYKDGGDIMVFNNGLGRVPSYSSVEIIKPPTSGVGVYSQSFPFGPTTQKWIYKDSIPVKFYSNLFSGASRLSNGNTLICDGVAGRFFEINSQNKTVWEYKNPVAANDEILEDGNVGGSSVFRCTFYNRAYSGFNGKTLTPMGPIEKKSYNYSCPFVAVDNVLPYPIKLMPANREKKVSVNTVTEIFFNERVFKGNIGNIKLYENSLLKYKIPIESAQILVTGNNVSVILDYHFENNKQIQISIDKGCFKDSSGNEMLALDSADWGFTIGSETKLDDIVKNRLKGIYPNPTNGKIRIPYETNEPKVEIINNVGQVLKLVISNKTNRELEVDMSDYSNGLYSILVNNQFIQTLIKE
jgi:hypothetical protein